MCSLERALRSSVAQADHHPQRDMAPLLHRPPSRLLRSTPRSSAEVLVLRGVLALYERERERDGVEVVAGARRDFATHAAGWTCIAVSESLPWTSGGASQGWAQGR